MSKPIGYRPWIENQFATPATKNVPYILENLSADPQNPYGSTLMFNSWWKNSVTAPDQLRQRAAFALSEILVVSDTGPLNNNGRVLADYYDTLLDSCFGNFRDILKQVTLSPAMGVYLDMRGNTAGNIVNRPASLTKTTPAKSSNSSPPASIGRGRTARCARFQRQRRAHLRSGRDHRRWPASSPAGTGDNRWLGGRLPTNFSPSVQLSRSDGPCPHQARTRQQDPVGQRHPAPPPPSPLQRPPSPIRRRPTLDPNAHPDTGPGTRTTTIY